LRSLRARRVVDEPTEESLGIALLVELLGLLVLELLGSVLLELGDEVVGEVVGEVVDDVEVDESIDGAALGAACVAGELRVDDEPVCEPVLGCTSVPAGAVPVGGLVVCCPPLLSVGLPVL
jgi:hypothetical protein